MASTRPEGQTTDSRARTINIYAPEQAFGARAALVARDERSERSSSPSSQPESSLHSDARRDSPRRLNGTGAHCATGSHNGRRVAGIFPSLCVPSNLMACSSPLRHRHTDRQTVSGVCAEPAQRQQRRAEKERISNEPPASWLLLNRTSTFLALELAAKRQRFAIDYNRAQL